MAACLAVYAPGASRLLPDLNSKLHPSDSTPWLSRSLPAARHQDGGQQGDQREDKYDGPRGGIRGMEFLEFKSGNRVAGRLPGCVHCQPCRHQETLGAVCAAAESGGSEQISFGMVRERKKAASAFGRRGHQKAMAVRFDQCKRLARGESDSFKQGQPWKLGSCSMLSPVAWPIKPTPSKPPNPGTGSLSCFPLALRPSFFPSISFASVLTALYSFSQ